MLPSLAPLFPHRVQVDAPSRKVTYFRNSVWKVVEIDGLGVSSGNQAASTKISPYLEVRGGEMLSLLVVGVKLVADGTLVLR